MSVHFTRCSQYLPKRFEPSKFIRVINSHPDRSFHIENRNSRRQLASVKHLNVRYSSSAPPTLPGLEIIQWHHYKDPMNHWISEFAQSDVVLTATEKMIQFHDFTGLPWWSVIIITTVAMRTCFTLPFAIHQQYVSAKYEQVMHEMNTTVDKEVVQKINELAKVNEWDQKRLSSEYMKEMNERRSQMIKKYNCHPLKLTVMLVFQVPIWTILSSVLRNLTFMQPVQDITAQIVYAEMKLNSFLWISDLTTPDPVLPLFFTIANIVNVGCNVISRKGKKTQMEKIIILFHTTFCIFLTSFAMILPTSVVLYWTVSVWFSTIQNLIFLSPKVRQRLGIPLSKNIRPNPYTRIVNKLKHVYKFLRY